MLNSDAWYDAAELVVGVLLQCVPPDLARLVNNARSTVYQCGRSVLVIAQI